MFDRMYVHIAMDKEKISEHSMMLMQGVLPSEFPRVGLETVHVGLPNSSPDSHPSTIPPSPDRASHWLLDAAI